MKTFGDLKIGDKIYIVNFDPEREINSAHEAEVIELKKIMNVSIKITCKHRKNDIDVYSVYGDSSSTSWMGIENHIKVFASKEDAIEELKIWVEEAKQNLYETNKLLIKVKELK